MHIQIVTFQLGGLTEADYRAHTEKLAPAFADLPGLRSKVWLADPATNTYGGVYTWQDHASMRAYQDGEIFRGLRTNPGFHSVISRDFTVLPEPTKITCPGFTIDR